MMTHFNKLQTPLNAVERYPTTTAQQIRFQNLGWPRISVCNLWKLWSSPDFVSSAEREYLDKIEPFDEWEEFALFGCHYFLLVADTLHGFPPTEGVLEGQGPDTEDSMPVHQAESSRATEALFTEYPRGRGCRRFAAAMPIARQRRSLDDVGLFGGMGLTTRLDSYDVYSTNPSEEVQVKSRMSSPSPSSRMSHTITDLGDTGALLVGGRTSPDNALRDCWLYHKWLAVWERVDDLPQPLYRHQAVNLGDGAVLISTGRINSRAISAEYLVWHRRTGWVKCAYGTGDIPPPTYGATFGICSNGVTLHSTSFRYGILAGGMSIDSSMQQASWRWDIKISIGLGKCEPSIIFRRLTDFEQHANIARFGASVVSCHDQVYVLGGIIKDQILKTSNEICALQLQDCAGTCSPIFFSQAPDIPRPLLVGTTVVSTGETLLIMSGSAVCFSFGTFWNRGCFTLWPVPRSDSSYAAKTPWRYLHAIESEKLQEINRLSAPERTSSEIVAKPLPRIRLQSSSDFERVVQSGSPVILEGLDIGPCTSKWTAEYLKAKIGIEREVRSSLSVLYLERLILIE